MEALCSIVFFHVNNQILVLDIASHVVKGRAHQGQAIGAVRVNIMEMMND